MFKQKTIEPDKFTEPGQSREEIEKAATIVFYKLQPLEVTELSKSLMRKKSDMGEVPFFRLGEIVLGVEISSEEELYPVVKSEMIWDQDKHRAIF